MSDDDTTRTTLKTLWSETLNESLLVALEKNQPNQKIVDILKELKQKRFKANYITDKVRRSLSEPDAARDGSRSAGLVSHSSGFPRRHRGSPHRARAAILHGLLNGVVKYQAAVRNQG